MKTLTTRNIGRYKGQWQANTFYAKDDLVYIGDVIYVAIADFTSGATFDELNWDCPIA